jgi:hypothetical protein
MDEASNDRDNIYQQGLEFRGTVLQLAKGCEELVIYRMYETYDMEMMASTRIQAFLRGSLYRMHMAERAIVVTEDEE